jgi:hypothetical protein
VSLLLVLLALCACPGPALAQTLPTGPLRALDGELLVSGEASVTVGDRDDVAYFNYTDYEHNALRLFRVSLAGAWQPVRRLAFVAELRSEDLDRPRAYAAYVRFRPWTDRAFDIQAGRIPPAFGAYSRGGYSTDRTVIGYPLAYQYLTSIHPDAVPATAEDLLRMRARGWLSDFPVGNDAPRAGVPLVTGLRWDTGLQAHWAAGMVDATAAVTTGTLSDPHVKDNNGAPQVSGRVALAPIVGLMIGGSAARGAWLSRDVADVVAGAGAEHYAQTAWGLDAEYSRDHWLVRGEMIWSRWRVPFARTSPAGVDLDARALWVEGRYKLTPRIFTAARLDHLGFSDVPGLSSPVSWDAPVDRVEVAAGYYLQRNLVARAGLQHNERGGGRVRARTYLTAQLSYWF